MMDRDGIPDLLVTGNKRVKPGGKQMAKGKNPFAGGKTDKSGMGDSYPAPAFGGMKGGKGGGKGMKGGKGSKKAC